MKNRLNRLLLILFVVFGVFSAVIIRDLLGDNVFLSEITWYILSAAPIICMFSLQLLLCRTAKHIILKLLPTVILALYIGVCLFGFVTSTGWDYLGWLIFLLCGAPFAVGCVLSWIVYGITARLAKR